MSLCESCGASALSDAQFCEACGHRLGTPDLRKQTSESSISEAKPGSLRGEIAFLSGTVVDQAKVRIDNWKNRGEKTKIESERKKEQKREEREELRAAVRSPFARISRFVIGLSAMLMFVYLLTRMPRGQMSATMMLQLYKEFGKEYGFEELDLTPAPGSWSLFRF